MGKLNSINSSDLDYVNDAKVAVKKERISGANFLLYSIVLSVIGLIYWSSIAELDEITKGIGKVVPASSIQSIQDLEGGIIKEIKISEGQKVKKNQVLIVLDDNQIKSQYTEHLAKQQSLKSKLVRLYAQSNNTELEFPESILNDRKDLIDRATNLFIQNKKLHESKIKFLKKELALYKENLKIKLPLIRSGTMSKQVKLDLELKINDKEKEILEEIEGFQQKSLEEYNEIKSQIEGITESIRKYEDRLKRIQIKSPVDGVINKLYVTTIGGVIRGGDPIIDIVPDDSTLVVEAKIKPSDVAFLTADQKTIVKFTAYDFAIYGGLEGKLELISADTIEDELDRQRYYIIKVRCNKNTITKKNKDGTKGEELRIMVGMVSEVNILTGRRTILQYLTKPFHRMRFNSLRER